MPDPLHDLMKNLETASMLSTTLLRLIVAALLGGLIGLERELHHKPAGLRTNMFICFGSAMFTFLSVQLAGEFTGDHTRIAAQIIPGIGFIGAGSILHSRGSVQGLTTAATLFVVASIGMAAGGGLFLPAIFATILLLLALNILGWFETRFNLKPLRMTYEAAGENADNMILEVTHLLEEERRPLESVQVQKGDGGTTVRFAVDVTHKEHLALLKKFRRMPVFTRIAFLGERE